MRLAALPLMVMFVAHQAVAQGPLKEGLEALNNGDAKLALDLLRTAVEQRPSSPKAHNFYGIALSRTGARTQAIAEFSEALRLQPQYPEALYHLGVALTSQGRHSDGIQSLRSALAVLPDFPEAEEALGAALTVTGDIAGAIEAFQNVARKRPGRASAHNHLGLLYLKLGEHAVAESHFRKAFEVDPHSAEFNTNLGHVLRKRGDLQEASELLSRAISINAKFPKALRSLAHTLQDRGDFEGAARRLRELVVIEASAENFTDLGYALLRSHQLQQAIASLREAVDLAPESPRPRFYLAHSLALAGDIAAALNQYEAASRLHPDNPEYRLQYGVALARPCPEEGVVQLRKAIELYSGKEKPRLGAQADSLVSAHYALGGVLLRLGNRHEAAQQFQRAKELRALADSRAQAVIHLNRGIELLNQGAPAEAIPSLRRSLVLEPAFPEALHMLAVAYTARRHWPEANEAFLAALENKPSDPHIHFNFGRCLRSQGDWEGAVREFSAVVELEPSHAEALCLLAKSLLKLGHQARFDRAMRSAKELGPCELTTAP